MSDKSVLCLAGDGYVPDDDRIGGPGQPATYHRKCAIEALAEAETEFAAAGGRGVDLAEEIDWLRERVS